MKTFFLLFTLKICALLLMNFLWGFIAAYVLQLVTPNSILCNLHGFFKNYRLLILAIIFFINFEFNLDSNTIYTSNHDGENILNNDLNQKEVKGSITTSISVNNVSNESIQKLAEGSSTLGQAIIAASNSLQGAAVGTAAVTGAGLGFKVGSTPVGKAVGAALGAAGMTAVYMGGKAIGSASNELGLFTSSTSSNTPSSNSSNTTSTNIASGAKVDTTFTNNINENSNYSSLEVIPSNTDINLNSSNINLELDINTIFINSPLEVNSQTVYDILSSILVLNCCSFFLTIIILFTFLQYLVSSKGYELNFLLHLPFGKKIQTILKKAIKFSGRNLLIYLFVFWSFIFIFNFTSFFYLLFFVVNLDDLINIYLNSKN